MLLHYSAYHGYRFVRSLIFAAKWEVSPRESLYYTFLLALAFCLGAFAFAFGDYLLVANTSWQKIQVRRVFTIFCKLRAISWKQFVRIGLVSAHIQPAAFVLNVGVIPSMESDSLSTAAIGLAVLGFMTSSTVTNLLNIIEIAPNFAGVTLSVASFLTCFDYLYFFNVESMTVKAS